ncbi:MAG: DHHA1 domain-containing protein [Candidatus Lokiarchaeota archaeon]|nr:DHHA1 domain-containing protein [Candidatus Harpocratesius repetitus]
MNKSNFDTNLETIALEFLENIEKYDKIHLLYHSDADGICSGLIIEKLLSKLRKPFKSTCINLTHPWEIYLSQINLISDEKTAVIFSDLCPSGELLYQYAIKFQKADFYILDHHRFAWPQKITPPKNVYNANPTLFGLHGLKEIVGSALNYLFSVAVDESMSKYAWIATIGIAGDTLAHIDDYQSYNRIVIERALDLEQVQIKKGICLYGGQHLRLDSAMAFSIFPYLPAVEGSRKKAKQILQNLSIDPSKKVEDCSEQDVEILAGNFSDIKIIGDFLIYPTKKGILHHSFEHAQLLSILGHEHPESARLMVGKPQITQGAKQEYNNYIGSLVHNLTAFVQIPKIITNYAIFVDLTNQVPINQWSDTGSFASVNHIYDSSKMLFIGGLTDTGEYKLSVRCTPEFMKQHDNKGAVHVIRKITQKLGGNGGGHGLAGGMRLPSTLFEKLHDEIDKIIINLSNL